MTNELIKLVQDLKAQSEQEIATSGRKVVQFLCLASPIELFEAVGVEVKRLMPSGDESELRGGRFLASDSCSFCKAVLGGIDLSGSRPDAVLGSTTCDQMRRNLEIISRDFSIPVFVFNAPRTADNAMAREYARQDLYRLGEEVSRWAGVRLETTNLSAAIGRRQALLKRLAAIQERRKKKLPTVSGAEFHALMILYQTSSPDLFEQHLPIIENLLDRREPLYHSEPLRIALLGSCVGEADKQIIELVEETRRAVIVYDAVCTGSRALRIVPDMPEDPFKALLAMYHDQVLCPHKRPNDRLFDLVAQDVQKLNVQGVIFKTLKFCHPWGFEARRFKDSLRLPFLHLDHDYSPSAMGQLRTRIHAFLEQLSLSG